MARVKQMASEMESRIRQEEIRMLHGGMLFSLLATLAVSSVMFFVMREHANSSDYLTMWFVVMMISMLLRAWDTYCFVQASPMEQKKESWGLRFLIGSTFAGCWWGMLAWLGHSSENEYQILIVVCIVGVAGGSLATLSYRWQTIIFFIMPALILLELNLIFSDNDFSNVVSYLLAIFILFTVSTSLMAYKNSNQNIRLRVEADYNEAALREAKDEAEQANAAKSIFLSNMSHELRTPLHAILGYTQLLEYGGSLSKEQSNNLGEINEAGQHLLVLVNQTIDLARIEEGDLNITMEPVSLDKILKECVSLLRPLADARNMQFDMANIRVQAHADYTRLKQSILNVLTNSIKYGDDGSVVTVKCYLLENNRIRIDVTDKGRGISKDQQALLFKPFSRLDSAEGIDGTGIGLSIVKQLVEKMDGTVSIQSEVGKGSVFSIELNSYVSDIIENESQKKTKHVMIKPVHDQDHAKILIVDDSRINLRMIEYQLQVLGYKTDLATTGDEALQLFRNNQYGLIITDCHMPIMDGYELANTIRTKEKSDIPIIALTADAYPETEDKCLASGMNARLIKPMNMEMLKAAVDQWLKVAVSS